MRQVFIANPKGGCGKTTIATQLAAYYANIGLDVLLLDHDAQRSSSDWVAARADTLPRIRCEVAEPRNQMDAGGAHCVIHDMPAAWSLDHVAEIIHPKDCVLIPVLASPNDIKACIRFIMGLSRSGVMESGIDVALVANRVKARARYSTVLHVFLERLNLPMLSSLRDTQNYVAAMECGKTIFDLPQSKVSVDLEQWQPILSWLEFEQEGYGLTNEGESSAVRCN